jgi:SAM-dependent methyltransferase
MGFYNTTILPKVLDLACGTKPIAKQREKVIPQARGDVVEIGIGSGLNLPHYDPAKVRRVTGIDPDDGLWHRAEPRASACDFPVDRLGLSGETLPLGDACADTVVVTYALCTIPDPVAALREMGTGDLSVGKKIKEMGEAFYGRAKAYEAPLADGDLAALSEAFERNMLEESEPNPDVCARLAEYALKSVKTLDAQPIDALLAGEAPQFAEA